VTSQTLADVGQFARRHGLDEALQAPAKSLFDADRIGAAERVAIAHAIKRVKAVTVGDLCTIAVDSAILETFGPKRVVRVAVAVGSWIQAVVREGASDLDAAYDDADDDDDSPPDLTRGENFRVESREVTRWVPPPSEGAALREWASERGLLEYLELSADDPAQRFGAEAVLPGDTIAGILTAPAPPPRPAPPVRQRDVRYGWQPNRTDPRDLADRMRRDGAAGLLRRFAENLVFLAARRRDDAMTARPLDPVLQPFAAAVQAALAPLAARTDLHRLPGVVIPVRVVYRDGPPRLAYDEASIQHDILMMGYQTPNLVTIALSGWETQGIAAVCKCARSSRGGCVHPRMALEAVLELLVQPTWAAYPALHAFITTPAWTRFFARLDHALAHEPEARPGREERLCWLIRRDDRGVSVEPQLQKKTRGAWARPTRMAPSTFNNRTDLWITAADARAAEILTSSSRYDREEAESFRTIEALTGAANVFLERHDTAVVIQTLVPRLQLVRASDGASELRVAVGDKLFEADEFLARAPDGRHFIDVDGAANHCHLCLVERDLTLALQALVAEPAAFPDHALPDVLARFERLQRRVGLDLPPDLRGESITADERIVCRLTPIGDSGLRVELRVRPLPGAGDWVPGQGPRALVASRPQGRFHTERDFDAECGRALHLSDALELTEGLRAGPFQFDVVDADRALGLFMALRERPDVVVEWPSETWRMDEARRGGLRLRVTDRRDWFGLEGGVEIDGQTVSIAALIEAVKRGQRYVMVGPRRFALIEEDLRRRIDGLKDVVFVGRAGVELGAPASAGLVDLVEDERHLEVIPSFVQMRSRLVAAAAHEPQLPASFAATLRPYQIEGFRWLGRLAEGGTGACLADDMGLGKTVQLLAVLSARAAKGPALVVAPTSVVPNWIAEARRFAPGLRPVLYRGKDRAAALVGLGAGDLLVTSYSIAVMDEKPLAAIPFAALVLDEAQAIKNAATRRSRAIRNLNADWRVALSGTPIENHLGELWSLYRIVAPALFGSWEHFRERFATPIERGRDPERRAALANLLRPFLLRRTKEAVAPELPAKTEILRLLDLSPEERKLYEATRLAALASLENPGKAKAPGNEAQERIQILAALTRLRQLACHPKLGDSNSSAPSTKLKTLTDVLVEMRDAGHRALVFSQFTRFLDLAQPALEASGLRVLGLDGSTPAEIRELRVAAFQRGEADAFLISLRAGGTGLNLTAADYVIHLDPWWNPAVEDQATDRAHRIGQTKAITVLRMVARGTVEETVLSLHAEKRGLAASVLEGADSAARLGTKELIALLRSTSVDEPVDDDDDADLDEETAADTTAEQEIPETGGPAGLTGPVALAGLDALIAATLAPFAARDRSGNGTHKVYKRALEGFRAFVAQAAAPDGKLAGQALESQVDGYLTALADGSWPAARSALGSARTALAHLRRVARERAA
jgi:superfamily II DNA or RNA helicase